MTLKVWILIGLAVLLGGFSLYLNKDALRGGAIQLQISDRSRPDHSRRPLPKPSDEVQTDPVHFTMNRELKLTEIKVVPLSAIQTNKYPDAVWHLVSDSNSAPVEAFAYGQHIRGMRPAIKGASPDPLEPGVAYRLYVAAGTIKAEHDFSAEPRSQ